MYNKVGEHIPFLVFNVCNIDIWWHKNKHNACRGENSVRKFHISLTEHTMKIIKFEKKKMVPLTSK